MIDGVTVMLNYKPGETTHDSTTGGGIAFTGVEGLNVGVAMEDNNTTDGAVVENTVVICNICNGCIYSWFPS